MKRIIRVFPRRTLATPIDDLAVVGRVPDLFDEADEVHVSVAFTWDIPLAEKLASAWRHVAPVRIGGPAIGSRGEEFEPGLYVRHGYTVTSRGCPNKCWFCSVWKREGNVVRELPIRDGWNVLDDNLLACSSGHIRSVFAMLGRQKEAPQFTGGLEAKILQPWHAEELRAMCPKPKQLFFAYDTPDDLPHLQRAGQIMRDAGHAVHPKSHALRCYVLCGWPKDTTDAAEKRMAESMAAGFTPMAMVWRGEDGKKSLDWAKFQRAWARPCIIYKTALSGKE